MYKTKSGAIFTILANECGMRWCEAQMVFALFFLRYCSLYVFQMYQQVWIANFFIANVNNTTARVNFLSHIQISFLYKLRLFLLPSFVKSMNFLRFSSDTFCMKNLSVSRDCKWTKINSIKYNSLLFGCLQTHCGGVCVFLVILQWWWHMKSLSSFNWNRLWRKNPFSRSETGQYFSSSPSTTLPTI